MRVDDGQVLTRTAAPPGLKVDPDDMVGIALSRESLRWRGDPGRERLV
jgi:hypothetical protein